MRYIAQKERRSGDIHDRTTIINAEAIIDKHGAESVCLDVIHETVADIEEYTEYLKENIGVPIEIVSSRILDEQERVSRSTFGFSEKGWKSLWNPPGPKKNCGPPPDPNLN